jgi:hypothetical protein
MTLQYWKTPAERGTHPKIVILLIHREGEEDESE